MALTGIGLKDLEEVSNFKNSLMRGSESARMAGPPLPKTLINLSENSRVS